MAELIDAFEFPVLLVRHGESEWNVARLTQGQTHHPALTESGRDHARSAGRSILAALSSRGTVQVWSSDLVRARQTAELVVETLAPVHGPVAVREDPRLREQHLGSLEGRSYDETWAAAEEHDWSDPTLPMAGGESPAQVHARLGEVLGEGIAAAQRGPVVLVSHGDAIRVALALLAGHGPGEGEWVEVPNGAVFEIGRSGHRRLG